MGMTCGYGPARDRDAMISLIHRAVDLGVNFFDTAECYGPFANEELLGEALQPIRHNVFVATKFGLKSIGGRPVPDSRPESIRQSVEDSLRRLRTDHVDLLFQHRVDPRVPIEEVAETVGQLVQEGKVCHWGLSEASLNTIRRAHHILPLTAVENEYSPLWRDAERGLLALLDELGIGLVASSPIGKGLLSGQLSADMLFGKDDFRYAPLPAQTSGRQLRPRAPHRSNRRPQGHHPRPGVPRVAADAAAVDCAHTRRARHQPPARKH